MSWQKAVAELTAERGRAESAARVIKRLGSVHDVVRAELTYGNGKAEADAVISAFDIALEEGKGLDDLADLEARMKVATEARETLGKQATALVKPEDGKEKGVLELVGVVLPDLLKAVGALWTQWRQGETSLRQTIAARLQEARWLDFAKIGE
jgi:hypothetical protein